MFGAEYRGAWIQLLTVHGVLAATSPNRAAGRPGAATVRIWDDHHPSPARNQFGSPERKEAALLIDVVPATPCWWE